MLNSDCYTTAIINITVC